MTEYHDEQIQVSVNVLNQILEKLNESTEVTKTMNQTLLLLIQQDRKSGRVSGNLSDLTFSSCATIDSDIGRCNVSDGLSKEAKLYQQALVENNNRWKSTVNSDLESFLSSPIEFTSFVERFFPALNDMRYFFCLDVHPFYNNNFNLQGVAERLSIESAC